MARGLRCSTSGREPRLEHHHRLRFTRRLGRRIAEQRKHPRDVLEVRGASRLEGGLALHVVVAVRQTQPALARHRDHLRRVREVLHLAERERRRDADRLKVSEHLGQRARIADGCDALELRRERRRAVGLDGPLVHPARVEVGNFSLRAARRPALGPEALDQAADEALVLLIQDGIDAPVRAIRRYRVGLEPGAVGEAKEIRARRDRAIDPTEK
jgi:hypothetical protein